VLVINSAIGLFYYLRVIAAVYARPEEVLREGTSLPFAGSAVLACLFLALVWLGVYPGPFLSLIERIVQGL
jgi:NADH-quinone oxidoreductase subunit N